MHKAQSYLFKVKLGNRKVNVNKTLKVTAINRFYAEEGAKRVFQTHHPQIKFDDIEIHTAEVVLH